MSPLDPGGRIMDRLRSCYSTKMRMWPGGPELDVQWYFVPATNPVIPVHAFGSLNWVRPDYPTDQIGEVVGAPRPWRNGSVPAFVGPNPTHSIAGLADWFVHGAPGPGDRWKDQDWLGRFFPNLDAAHVPAHPFVTPPAVARLDFGFGLVAGVYHFSPAPTVPPFWQWGANPFFVWQPSICGTELGPVALLGGFVNLPGSTVPFSLRPLSFDAGTHTSVWDDPDGVALPAGHTATLVAP